MDFSEDKFVEDVLAEESSFSDGLLVDDVFPGVLLE
jgi:hypothetical protein